MNVGEEVVRPIGDIDLCQFAAYEADAQKPALYYRLMNELYRQSDTHGTAYDMMVPREWYYQLFKQYSCMMIIY